jgi:hypothetical protein
MPLIVLWLSALVFATFGVLFLADPSGWASTVDVAAASATARAEIRAMYGGLELGMALFLAWCALDPARVRIGLTACVCFFAGLALARGASALLDGGARPIVFTLVAIEAIAAVVAFVALRMAGRA